MVLASLKGSVASRSLLSSATLTGSGWEQRDQLKSTEGLAFALSSVRELWRWAMEQPDGIFAVV